MSKSRVSEESRDDGKGNSEGIAKASELALGEDR